MSPVVTIILDFCHLKMSLFGHFFNFVVENLPDRAIKTHTNLYDSESKIYKLSIKNKYRDEALNVWGTEFFYRCET